jgi:molecular chaperone GrpE
MAETDDSPADPTAEASALEGVARERDEYLARWQRATADYQNLKRRSAGEVENAVRRSLENLLGGMCLVVDHLELALRSPATGEEARALARGVELTLSQLLALLRQEGVEQVAAGGDFDPNLHEAVATLETSELPPGRIVDTLRKGYTWRGQVLRYAHVRVARAPQGAAPEPDERG